MSSQCDITFVPAESRAVGFRGFAGGDILIIVPSTNLYELQAV
jgi:hypothetical protein